MTPCTHSNYDTSDVLPYFGAVSRDENRAAHGGVRYRETCQACGATRDWLCNGRHVETGEWTSPEPETTP